jgi:hypothetical protein
MAAGGRFSKDAKGLGFRVYGLGGFRNLGFSEREATEGETWEVEERL